MLPVWSRAEYGRRLPAQERGEMVQAVAWIGDTPAGRGMVLFPNHGEYSVSAAREHCAEVRDVFVSKAYRRKGVARKIMAALETAGRDAALGRIGLAVGTDDAAAPARALYETLGYRFAHGPFINGARLDGADGPIPVAAVLTYLVRDL